VTFLYAAARTPFGRFNGTLAGVRPDDLAAAVMEGVLATVPALDPAAIDEVIWPDRSFPASDVTAVSTTLGWRLVNPRMPKVLRERRERWGVAAVCIGAGQGLAVVLEKLAGAA